VSDTTKISFAGVTEALMLWHRAVGQYKADLDRALCCAGGLSCHARRSKQGHEQYLIVKPGNILALAFRIVDPDRKKMLTHLSFVGFISIIDVSVRSAIRPLAAQS